MCSSKSFASIAVLFCFTVIRCTTPSILATQAIQIGDAMNNQSRYDLAIQHYQEYLNLSPQLGHYRNPAKEAEVCRKLAHAYAVQGIYSNSIEYAQKAVRIDEGIPGNTQFLIEDFRLVGLAHAYQSNYKEGAQYLQKSINLSAGMDKSVKSSKRELIAETYLALAQINLGIGNYKEAESQSLEALALFQSIPEGTLGEVECKLILGTISREKSNLEDAMTWLNESKALAIQSQINTSRHEQAIGEVFFLRGEFEEGLRYKFLALDKAEKTNIKPQVILAQMRLGDAYIKLGDKIKANQYYQQAWDLQNQIKGDSLGNASLRMRLGDVEGSLQYFIESGATLSAGLVSLKMGQLYVNRENWDSATALLRRAKNYFDISDNKEGIAKTNLVSAMVENALEHSERAVSLARAVRTQTLQSDLKWQAFYQEGIAHENLGDIVAAKDAYEEAIDIIDEMRGNLTLEDFKTLFANSKTEVYDRLINLLLKYGNELGLSVANTMKRSFDYNEHARARAFLDMLGNKKIVAKSSDDEELLIEEQLLRLKIQQTSKELDSDTEINRASLLSDLEKAQLAYDDVLQRMKLANPAYETVTAILPPSMTEIQATLEADAAILEYWVSDDKLIAWVVTSDTVNYVLVDIPRHELTRQVTLARRTISSRLTNESAQSLKKLYSWLISPAIQLVEGKTNLIIIPHRTLHFVPFQALLAGDGKFLIENFVVSYAPSAAIWFYCKSKKTTSDLKVLGMALGKSKIGNALPLPGTTIELNQIAKVYNDFEILQESEFTETNLKQCAADFNYLHIATHGTFNKQQPKYSYLLMNDSDTDDGRLTVDEILNLNLKSDLITLSACETGLGDLSEGDDLVGMSRAFIYAGTPQVVVSLWKVDDATTAWLMTRFHQYRSAGQQTSTSLAYAQRDLLDRNLKGRVSQGIREISLDQTISTTIAERSKLDSRDPYYWAPFVLIGSN